MPNGPEQLDPIIKQTLLPFAHLFQFDNLGPVAADDKTDVGTDFADAGQGGDQEVDTFTVDQSTDANNGHWAWLGCCGMGCVK